MTEVEQSRGSKGLTIACAPAIPPVLAVSCDFDATITLVDSVQALLDAYGAPAWLDIEADWHAGLIGARKCLASQTRLLRISETALDAWADGLAVDPQAVGFLCDCRRRGLATRVVSDGYDRVIHRVLARMGLAWVAVSANQLEHVGYGHWEVRFPNAHVGCPAGTCKCRATSRPRLHIGDGRSDMCVSDASELVFAKGALLESRRLRGRPVIDCADFAEARRLLQSLSIAPEPGSRAFQQQASA